MTESVTRWTRSSFCADNSCVEVAKEGEFIAMRDGENVVRFTSEEWNVFLDHIIESRIPIAE